MSGMRAIGVSQRRKRLAKEKKKIWGRVDLWSQLYGRNGRNLENGVGFLLFRQ